MAMSMAYRNICAIGLLCAGIGIGSKLPQGFFKPWDQDGNFYGGELVKHTPEPANPGDFYNLCKQGKVVYVHNQKQILVEWTGCTDIDFPNLRGGFLDLHSSSNLVRK
jgi:hypothetical protein